jgi:hypothetical protein
MKVDLEFNLESLKITDLPEDEQEHSGATSRGSSSIIESIKRKTAVANVDPVTGEISTDPTQGISLGKVRANVESTKLREILNNMSSDED